MHHLQSYDLVSEKTNFIWIFPNVVTSFKKSEYLCSIVDKTLTALHMSKTLLVLTNSVGGLYNFRQEVLQALVNEGFRVVISAPYNKKIKVFFAMGCEYVQTEFKIKGTNPIRDLQLANTYRKLIRQYQPVAVLSYTIKPNLYGGLACRWCHVAQLANITGLGTAVENPGWMQHLTVGLYRACMRGTRLFFFQNKSNFEFFRRHHLIHHQSELIPGSGVNLRYHTFQPYPVDTPVSFVFLSRILPQKGIDNFLEAAAILKQRYPSVEFHVVGSGSAHYKQRLAELSQQGIVVYHGQQLDVRPFYRMAHCTVLPSYYPEGMSNVLLESCAAGRPIITTSRPGCGEAVDDGVNGFIVRQQDTDDLVDKMERFIQLPPEEKKQMGINARKKMEREFDRIIVVDAYLRAVSEVIGESAK